MLKQTTLMLVLACCCTFATAQEADVERAVLDYVEGFYEGDTSKLHRSVLPEVQKYGYYRPKDKKTYAGEPMSFEQMLKYALSVKKRGPVSSEAPKKVELLDVQDQTAAAKLTAWWGTDYILLGKYDGKWKIVQVLWQSPPTS